MPAERSSGYLLCAVCGTLYLLVMVGVIGGSYLARSWAISVYGSPQAQAQWDEWRAGAFLFVDEIESVDRGGVGGHKFPLGLMGWMLGTSGPRMRRCELCPPLPCGRGTDASLRPLIVASWVVMGLPP